MSHAPGSNGKAGPVQVPAAEKPTATADPPPPAAPPTPPPVLASLQAQLTRWQAVIDGIRTRADLSAKGLGAIASLALGAVGIDRLDDLSPTDWHVWTVVWATLAVVGFAAIAAFVAWLVVQLARVNEPVKLSTSPAALAELDRDEQALVLRAFGDTARANQASSLRAYEARAARLDRVALRRPAAQRADLQLQAETIRLEIRVTFGAAAADVVRLRSGRAFTSAASRTGMAAAIVGFVLFAVGTDYLDGARDHAKAGRAAQSERIAIVQACASARKTYADQKVLARLPDCPATAPAP